MQPGPACAGRSRFHLALAEIREALEKGEVIEQEGALVTVPKDQIDERTRGKSAMPEDLMKHLSRREVRDLVAFLAGLQ